MNNKENGISFNIIAIICTFAAILGIACGFFISWSKKQNKTPVAHEYVETIVTDKYINDGFGTIYMYKDTEYVLVTTYEENEEKRTITTIVDINVYNNYNIGDVILYCKNHNKLIIYE